MGTGADSPRSGRWRRLGAIVLAAGSAAAVAFLITSGIQARQQTRRSDTTLATVRAEERVTLHQLSVTDARLAAVRGESDAARRTLGVLTAELSGERAQLARQQSNLYVQGVSISALDTCLGGVEAALNEVGLNDQAGAVTSLNGVSASCRTAGASVG